MKSKFSNLSPLPSTRETDIQLLYLQYYKEAEDMCLQAYGEFSVLTSRIYLNIGIMYEDKRDYFKAYDYFIKWQDVCVEVCIATQGKKVAAGVVRVVCAWLVVSIPILIGGYSHLVWTEMCSSSLKTPTHFWGHFDSKKYPFLRIFLEI